MFLKCVPGYFGLSHVNINFVDLASVSKAEPTTMARIMQARRFTLASRRRAVELRAGSVDGEMYHGTDEGACPCAIRESDKLLRKEADCASPPLNCPHAFGIVATQPGVQNCVGLGAALVV